MPPKSISFITTVGPWLDHVRMHTHGAALARIRCVRFNWGSHRHAIAFAIIARLWHHNNVHASSSWALAKCSAMHDIIQPLPTNTRSCIVSVAPIAEIRVHTWGPRQKTGACIRALWPGPKRGANNGLIAMHTQAQSLSYLNAGYTSLNRSSKATVTTHRFRFR